MVMQMSLPIGRGGAGVEAARAQGDGFPMERRPLAPSYSLAMVLILMSLSPSLVASKEEDFRGHGWLFLKNRISP
jgi:hypothetical protein